MLNTEKNKLHNKSMRITRDAALLLLLYISLSNAVTLCTFRKILGPTVTKKRPLGAVIV
jgi:hypothetical protein